MEISGYCHILADLPHWMGDWGDSKTDLEMAKTKFSAPDRTKRRFSGCALRELVTILCLYFPTIARQNNMYSYSIINPKCFCVICAIFSGRG